MTITILCACNPHKDYLVNRKAIREVFGCEWKKALIAYEKGDEWVSFMVQSYLGKTR